MNRATKPRTVTVRSATLKLLENIMEAQEKKNPALAAKQRRLLAILAQRRRPS